MRRCALCTARLIVSTAALALGHAAAAAEAPLFLDDSVLEVELAAPLTTLHEARMDEEREELPSTFVYTDASGDAVTLPVKVKARGNFRRRECGQAPLRLNFKKGGLGGTIFDGQDKLKLVRPCNKSPMFEQYVVHEYLAYRLYALLSDYHLRVRPLEVTYRDTDGGRNERTRFGFFIEDRHAMAARLGLAVVEEERIDYTDHEAWQIGVFELFSFMIGSHDFSVRYSEEGDTCCHNSVPIAAGGLLKDVYMVPYDFDFSGLIDAKYAAPPPSLKIESVRDRHYKGRCHSPEQWQKLFDHFRARRDAAMALYDDSPHLMSMTRSRTKRYLRDFYKLIDKPRRVKNFIYSTCFAVGG
ncbi:MAG: hypothetical protein AAGD86_00605 [Pseudomonadota bacterium]